MDRQGLGNGFSILLLADVVPQITGPLGSGYAAVQAGVLSSSLLLNGVLMAAALVGATLWMFSAYRLPEAEAMPHPSLVGRPACGVIPLAVIPAILGMAAALMRLGHPGQTSDPRWLAALPITLVLGAAAAVALAFLFNRPDRIAAVWRSLSPNPPGGIPRLKAVLLESALFITLAVLVQAWVVRRVGAVYIPNSVAIILATGIVCDLVHEWRAHQANIHLSPIWEIHQVYAVAPTLQLLQTEGFRAFAKGMRLRALLQFFGPYVPVQILVPAEQAQAARALLETRWPDSSGIGPKKTVAPEGTEPA